MQCACKKGLQSNWDFKCGRCRTKADWANHAVMLLHAAVAPGKVTVVNKHTHVPTPDDVYIGRGSRLGNPHAITASVPRKMVCALYAGWLTTKLSQADKPVIKELDDIANKVLKGMPVNLVCFCAPQQCHGDYIKELVDKAVRIELKLNSQH
jgi:hypothetical protein